MNTKAFGIDLGTTHSVLAHIDYSGRAGVIPNTIGEEITPSTVYFEAPLEVTVGTTAKNSAVVEPRNFSQLVKRHLGSPGVRYPHHGHDYTPMEISALVLKYLAECGRKATGVVVEDVVITVPAHFGVAERKATRAAGEIAGFKVRDVIVEPVAAALHYGFGKGAADGVRHVLVCDLGGGTYDTTVIRIEGDHIQVLCTKGEGNLGGADWDARVRDFLVDEFIRKHPRTDPTADEVFLHDVTQRAEKLKKELSTAQTRSTDLRFRGEVVRVELTREKLEELTADLVSRVTDLTRLTVQEAERKGVRELDDVLLVGGMSKSPAIGAAIHGLLGIEPKLHEPHLAVAKGAAIFASRQQVRISENVKPDSENGIGIPTATVVSRGIGVKAIDPSDPMVEINPMNARKVVQHILLSGETLPTRSEPYPFGIVYANSRMAEIEVWEQKGVEDSMELSANRLVGKGFLRDMPPKPKGAHILIWFAMSETGELSVHASDPDSQAQVQFELRIEGLSEPDVEQSRAWIARHRVQG
ncbi:Hsp70 family protein [Lentzea sp. NPDC051838]|uniref:Hsp70 family protein n=1 Tax=Lentzea sp. NPDC051838 TaxID=3154849 RepID=UPI0034418D9D